MLAVEEFVPKFERSKTRKREHDTETDEKIADRKKRQSQAKSTLLHLSWDMLWPSTGARVTYQKEKPE